MAYKTRKNAGAKKTRGRRTRARQSQHYSKGFRLAKRVARKTGSQKQIRQSVFRHIRNSGSEQEKELGLRSSSAAAIDFRTGIREAAAQLAGFEPTTPRRGASKAARVDKAAYKGGDMTYRELQKAVADMGHNVIGVKRSKLESLYVKGKGGSKPKKRRSRKSGKSASGMSYKALQKAVAKKGHKVIGVKRAKLERLYSGTSSKSSNQSQAEQAMALYHSGEVSSLKEAWAEVKGERPNPSRKRRSRKRRARKSRPPKAPRFNPRDFGAEFLFI